ncbi:hypothetical protein C0J52_19130 [Blattella germanica]|nr:hypothetical protein C0J52_19130 [Blattella germanica]
MVRLLNYSKFIELFFLSISTILLVLGNYLFIDQKRLLLAPVYSSATRSHLHFVDSTMILHLITYNIKYDLSNLLSYYLLLIIAYST